jgi:hypothetical protein
MRVVIAPEQFAALKHAHFHVLAARLDFLEARDRLARCEAQMTETLHAITADHDELRGHDQFEYDDAAHALVVGRINVS